MNAFVTRFLHETLLIQQRGEINNPIHIWNAIGSFDLKAFNAKNCDII